MRPVATITGMRATTRSDGIADAWLKVLLVVDGGAVEVEDHDTRDECPREGTAPR